MCVLSRTSQAVLIIAALGLVPVVQAAAPVLDLPTAERLALERDLTVPSLQASATALQERAVADGQLPDPRLKLGAMNLPVDSFDRDQEPMTQMQVGVQQAFPPGKTLSLRQQRREHLAGARTSRADARSREVLRDVRQQYLELYYAVHGERLIDESRRLFEQLVEVTEYQYAAGRKNQQDVLRADVELALLDDRRTQIRTEQDRARAALARLIGHGAAAAELAADFPALPALSPRLSLEAGLDEHPVMVEQERQVQANHAGVDMARERYKPGWMLDVTYGDRAGDNPDGSDRDDFMSAMVVLDIPLFTDKRQDRVLAASQQELASARLNRDDRRLELRRMLDADYAEWQRLAERVARYRTHVVPQAAQNAASSLSAYQSGVSDFTGLMRARLTELDSRLMALRLRTNHAKAQARLLYLAGEQP